MIEVVREAMNVGLVKVVEGAELVVVISPVRGSERTAQHERIPSVPGIHEARAVRVARVSGGGRTHHRLLRIESVDVDERRRTQTADVGEHEEVRELEPARGERLVVLEGLTA